MIRNEREFEITQEQTERFATALAQADATNPGRDLEMQELFKAALSSQLEELQSELTDYEQRRAGVQPVSPLPRDAARPAKMARSSPGRRAGQPRR